MSTTTKVLKQVVPLSEGGRGSLSLLSLLVATFAWVIVADLLMTITSMFSVEFLSGQVDHRVTCDEDMTAMMTSTKKIAYLAEASEANALMLQ